MRSFNFRLQRLLGFRNIQEEEAKKELNLRWKALEEENARLSGLKYEEESLLEKWQNQVEQNIELPRLQVTQEYSRRLDNLLMNQAEQYNKTKSWVEEQREVAMQCWRKKKVLEILKDKAKDEHIYQEKINEQKLIDEIVLNNYNRKGGD